MLINITGSEPIYEAQRFLRALHFDTGGKIPLVSPDGIFGPSTRAAVEKFQQLYSLPVNGEIDYETWTALYAAYLDALTRSRRPTPVYYFPETEGYVTRRGEKSDIVAIIQFMLRALSDEFPGIAGASPSGEYDDATIADVLEFQRLQNLPRTGFVDRPTWNMLADAYIRAAHRSEG